MVSFSDTNPVVFRYPAYSSDDDLPSPTSNSPRVENLIATEIDSALLADNESSTSTLIERSNLIAPQLISQTQTAPSEPLGTFKALLQSDLLPVGVPLQPEKQTKLPPVTPIVITLKEEPKPEPIIFSPVSLREEELKKSSEVQNGSPAKPMSLEEREQSDNCFFEKISEMIELKKANRENPQEVVEMLSTFIQELEDRRHSHLNEKYNALLIASPHGQDHDNFLHILNRNDHNSLLDTMEMLRMAYLIRAALYFNQFDFKRALKEYKAVERLYEGDTEAIFQVGRIYFYLGKYEKAEIQFKKALSYDGNHMVAFDYLKATHAFIKKTLLHPLQFPPTSTHHFLLLAHSFFKHGKLNNAEEFLELYSLAAGDNPSPIAAYLASCIALRRGKVKNALSCLPYVCEPFRKMLFNQAVKFKKNKQFLNALLILNFLVKQSPSVNALLERARVYLALNQKKLLKANCKALMKLNPNFNGSFLKKTPTQYLQLAHTLYNQGQLDRAGKKLDQMFKLPEGYNLSGRYLQACIALKQGKLEEALNLLPIQGLEVKKALIKHALKFKEHQLYKEALSIFDFLNKHFPSAYLLFERARIHLEMGNQTAAKEDYKGLKKMKRPHQTSC